VKREDAFRPGLDDSLFNKTHCLNDSTRTLT
jgi:hypothetical protein